MEHLFKLKKEGKTIGSCEWTEDWGWKYYNSLEPESKFTHFMVAQTGFTAHPFVTKDKNGKDVFAEDEIKGTYFWPDAKNPQTITGKVGWRDETFNWVLYHTPNTPECAELWQVFDIELIEDKQDD